MRVLHFPCFLLPARKLKPKFDVQAQKMFSLYVEILASSTLLQQHYFIIFIISKPLIYFLTIYHLFIIIIILLYNIVLVLPYINMNLPQVYTCSPSWIHLLPHTIPLGHPSAPAPSILYPASNLNWWFVSHTILYVF